MLKRSAVWLWGVGLALLVGLRAPGAEPGKPLPWVNTYTADFGDAGAVQKLWLPRWCEPKLSDGKLVLPPPGRQGRVLDYYDGSRFPGAVRVEIDAVISAKPNVPLSLGINLNSDGYDSGTGYFFQFAAGGCSLRKEAGSYYPRVQLGIHDGSHLNQPVEGAVNKEIYPEAGKVHHLAAERDGDHLSFWVDGALAFAYTDPHPLPEDADRGFVGLVSKNCTITVEKFRVLTLAGKAGAVVAPMEAPAGKPITIKGVAGCARSATTREDEGIHILQVYAYDGSGDIPATLASLMAGAWPADHGLNVAEAKALQAKFDEQLRYNIADCHLARTVHTEAHFQAKMVEVTGVLYERDGQKWVYPAEIKTNEVSEGDLRKDPAKAMFAFAPRMLEPDKPFAMPGKTPLEIKLDEGLEIKCILLPAGSFMQGSPFYQPYRWQDEYAHEVVLTRPFYFAEHPITQEVFEAVMHKNPSTNKGAKYPVEHVNYADIAAFCRIVSEKSGRKVRLPTDAEWEYTAHVGTSSPCFTVKYLDQLSRAGDLTYHTPMPVMSKPPNAWGIYDMYCGAWTDVSDYAANDSRVKTIDQTGPARDDPMVREYGDGPVHKAKGGEYYDDWRPSMHGAVDDKGNGAEGNTIFTIVVEATPEEIQAMKPAPR